ncbi:hypothetical protein [Methylobacterium flocculans]|uniref:hypothetical protein n=1 Tax=Methylobacterium flocculans TaxID=2984843 RepID=UPI0021F34B79|nr:hypothetical protein [Methylobacterium sp. FF17]
MANADRHKMGSAAQGKGTGTGAMTDLPDGILEENMVLSNRDKSRHNDERGLDSKMVQTEQYQDHAGNREIDPDAIESGVSGNTTGLASPKTDLSGAESSLASQTKD